MNELLEKAAQPDGFAYPSEFLHVIESGLIDVGPWQFLLGKWLRVRYEGLKNRFPDRSLVPFARRLDNDDIACWDQSQAGAVRVVHDFSAPGWEQRAEFSSFEDWYAAAKEEAKGYDA